MSHKNVKEIIVWDLKPTVRVGHFILGNSIDAYTDRFPMNIIPYVDLSSDVYDIIGTNSSLSVDRDTGKIIYVRCRDSCIYNGVELINIEFSILKKHLGAEPDEIDETVQYENGYEEFSADFDNLDLIVWVDNKSNLVTGIDCGDGKDESL